MLSSKNAIPTSPVSRGSVERRVWLMAARPRTLWAALVPVVLGTAVAWTDGALHLPSALVALACALLIQVGTNIANDYFDFRNGADDAARVGPVRVTQAGLASPEQVRRAFVLVFALAIALGAYLVWRGGWPIVLIGLVSVLAGVLYTGGPRPFGYLGLGDLAVFVFFGPVAVAGTHYVQAQTLSWAAVTLGVAPGLISTAVLVVNNLRDRETDARTGKRTLAVRLGRGFSIGEYAVALAGTALVPLALVLLHGAPDIMLLGMLFAIPAAVELHRFVRARTGPEFNRCLASTARLLVAYAGLHLLGLVLA